MGRQHGLQLPDTENHPDILVYQNGYGREAQQEYQGIPPEGCGPITPEDRRYGTARAAAGAVQTGEFIKPAGQGQSAAGGAQAAKRNKSRKEDPKQDPLM